MKILKPRPQYSRLDEKLPWIASHQVRYSSKWSFEFASVFRSLMNSNIKLEQVRGSFEFEIFREMFFMAQKNAFWKALMVSLCRSPDGCWVSEWLDVTPDNWARWPVPWCHLISVGGMSGIVCLRWLLFFVFFFSIHVNDDSFFLAAGGSQDSGSL